MSNLETRREIVAADHDTEIRRMTHRYRIRQLTLGEAADAGLTAQYVEAPSIDLRRLVVVRYVDFRTGCRGEIGGVVKFSRKGESPDVTSNIRLATPSDFRENGYEPGIADSLDGAQEADMGPYLASILSREGRYVDATAISATAKFAATGEPWVYCASIASTGSFGAGFLGELQDEFAESKGCDAAITAIDNPPQFARRLGIEFALSVEVGRDDEDDYVMGMLDREFARRVCGLDALPPVDTVVWVNHGPVHYENRRLVIKTERDMPTAEALRACFTKRTEFSGQREYRFAVCVAVHPLRKAIYLKASSELQRLTRRLDVGGG